MNFSAMTDDELRQLVGGTAGVCAIVRDHLDSALQRDLPDRELHNAGREAATLAEHAAYPERAADLLRVAAGRSIVPDVSRTVLLHFAAAICDMALDLLQHLTFANGSSDYHVSADNSDAYVHALQVARMIAADAADYPIGDLRDRSRPVGLTDLH
jgi:hypothetical protein